MDIIIQSLGFTAGEGLEAYVREKLEKLEERADIVRANVVLFLGPDSDPDRHHCEIRLEMPGNDPFVKKSADSFEGAIVETVDVLQQNITKAKEKQIDRTQRVQE